MMVRRLLVSITRRDFIKFVGFATLSAFAGVGFADCSGQSQTEFKPSTSNTPNTPQNTGYKLIYPDWTKPVPDDVIPHIIEIGKKGFDVFAPVSGSMHFIKCRIISYNTPVLIPKLSLIRFVNLPNDKCLIVNSPPIFIIFTTFTKFGL